MAYPPTIREAGALSDIILRALGFAAVYLPFNTIIIRAPWINDDRIRRHELCHHAQRQRDGLAFWAKAAWYVLRYGYHQSPYEIEATAAEHDQR